MTSHGILFKKQGMESSCDLTILMPCLNEAETLASCIRKARQGLSQLGLKGEILIADNGSTDRSVEIAKQSGARVVHIPEKGYGHALRGGLKAAHGKWVVFGDADDSCDFSNLSPFVEKLKQGFELVIGCRMPAWGGKIIPGAMPWKNQWIGTPALIFIGRLFFKCPSHDFNCGFRAITKSAADRMDLRTTGMEFASEMLIKAMIHSISIAEIPVTLFKDGRSRPPHLDPWRDGWRHLRFMLLYSPRWLFLVPGIFLFLLGLVASFILSIQTVYLGNISLDVGTLSMACMTLLAGFQIVTFAFYTKIFAIAEGLLPQDPKFSRWFRWINLEKGLLVGILLLGFGCLLFGNAWIIWKNSGYGSISYSENLRRLLPATTLMILGLQVVFSSFFMSVLGLKTSTRTPPS